MNNEAPLKRVGISMLEQLEETIKVGMALGFNMDGCEATLEKIIAEIGDVIVIEDFNEVREDGERYGTKFNERQGDMFNSFITNSNLIDVPLGGIVLEKGIPDHRPILLKESAVDYGLTLFRFFHSWLDIEGVEDNRLRNEHKSRLSLIEVKVVQNIATREDLIDRAASIKIIGDIDRKEAKKRLQNDIKRVLKNGIWIEDPGEVKAEFYEHFRSRFSCTSGDRPCLGDVPLNRLSCQQRDFLESDFLNDEIKRVVWESGGDRTPGPDGFTFNFIKVFWNVIELDVVRLVRDFFHSTYFPKGCNSSFISLIPKVANRLSQVIGSSVSVEQSAFISGRSILDGPLILCGNRRGG
ncbi:hypothetical protein Tco_0352892 [Tanacetum coccineum]